MSEEEDVSMRTILMIPVLFFGLMTVGCESEGPAEKAGRKIDETMEKTGKKIDEATDAAGRKLEDVGDTVREKTN